ncbi:MAG: FmdB family zinc ribbon protein [Anaerolineae bacterium]
MPIYEYRCLNCRRRFSAFWRTYSAAEEAEPKCTHCGSDRVKRLVSRIRVVRSEESRMEDLADPSAWGDFDENDPKSMGRFMRKMMDEMGDEVGDLGPEFEEVVDRLESGQDPEEIEKEVPDLAEGLEGGPAGYDDSLDF